MSFIEGRLSREEVLERVGLMSNLEQIEWMARLGFELTIWAREGYPHANPPGDLAHLMRCNEVQHRIYGRMLHLLSGKIWTPQSFVDLVFECGTDLSYVVARSFVAH